MRFEIIAYAGTEPGQKAVKSHVTQPEVHVVEGCPTIKNTFSDPLRGRIRYLCEQYHPKRYTAFPALGYGSVGSLIVFAHGLPNNAPALLHKKTNSWAPLFPERVASGIRADPENEFSHAAVAQRLMRMRQKRLSLSPQLGKLSARSKGMLLVLGALARSPRHDECISRRTGLTVLEVQEFVSQARESGWIGMSRHLTDAGHAQLAHSRKQNKGKTTADVHDEVFYYPHSLRAPIGISS
jgi:hypothetical protein